MFPNKVFLKKENMAEDIMHQLSGFTNAGDTFPNARKGQLYNAGCFVGFNKWYRS